MPSDIETKTKELTALLEARPFAMTRTVDEYIEDAMSKKDLEREAAIDALIAELKSHTYR